MYPETVYQLALMMTPSVGDVRAKNLIEHFGSATAIFHASYRELEAVGVTRPAAKEIKNFADYKTCEEEYEFIQKNSITALFITDAAYPQRLINCYDSPPLLFYKGNTDLNAPKIISVVGTRNNTDYGKEICERFIAEVQSQNAVVVSGLAFGIDSIAHRAALKNNLKTVGVLAHGLDKIYPAQNKAMAKEMLMQGGLLTNFMSRTKPDRQNFPERNRIVAGLCDALVVIESSRKGGSLITAELANDYNRDVFSFPGRVNDLRSEGCNFLIKNNKSILITCAEDLLEIMNWSNMQVKPKIQTQLFYNFSADEKVIYDLIVQKPVTHIDELFLQSGLSSSSVAQAILMLEMNAVIISMPGKMYKAA